ncbi:MAG TPA: aromatic ring-opening dioxygenase LigA [Propionicimonas sp.]|uniref:aromatic ring-opening dioxygenase LigA n=1 Tax=Propionicimonas sp. TaxID=1955623 RepID=UPI002F41E80E
MATTTRNADKQVRLLGLVSIIIGAVMIIAGAVTWGMVSTKLAAENITVSADAPMLAGAKVTGPIEAFVQADVINGHALKATGGKTYAQLDKEDPLRATAMNGSFLRSSLFTSVIAFGVALFAIGVGALAVITGWALRLLASREAVLAPEPVLANA